VKRRIMNYELRDKSFRFRFGLRNLPPGRIIRNY
jgi:hypothetical protein